MLKKKQKRPKAKTIDILQRALCRKIKNFYPLFIGLQIFLNPYLLLASSPESHYGILRFIQGEVRILPHQKPKIKKKAKIGMKVYPGDSLLSFKNSKAQILMIDKSLITLPPQSKIKIQEKNKKTPLDKKTPLKRTPYFISLIFGKLRSQVFKHKTTENTVQKNHLQKTQLNPSQKIKPKRSEETDLKKQELKKSNLLKINTYQIWTKSAVIGVRGTDFFVSFAPKQETTTATPFEGEISFYPIKKEGETVFPPTILKPGQILTHTLYFPPQRPVPLSKTKQKKLMQETKIPHSSSQPAPSSPKEASTKNKSSKENQATPNPSSTSLILPEDFIPQEKIQNQTPIEDLLNLTNIKRTPSPSYLNSLCDTFCIQENKEKNFLSEIQETQKRAEPQTKKKDTSFLTIKVQHEN